MLLDWRLAALLLAILMAGAVLVVAEERTINAAAEVVFNAMALDVVVVGLPVAYSRWTLAPGEEGKLASAVHAVALASVSLALFGGGGGSWPALAALVCSESASIGLTLHGTGLTSGLLSAVAAATAAVALSGHDDAGGPGLSAEALSGAGVAACAALLVWRWMRRWELSARQAGGRVVVLAGAVIGSAWLLPLSELLAAYSVSTRYAPRELGRQAASLALTTLHVQVPLGYLGVDYLRAAQRRKNNLLQVAPPTGGADGAGGAGSASAFSWRVARFLLATAVPYMLQRTALESVNAHALKRYVAAVENSFRLQAVLDDGALLTAAASEYTIEDHSRAIRSVVEASYSIVERKLFSVPKLALFPAIVTSHPQLTAVALPIALLVDAAKAKVVAGLTARV